MKKSATAIITITATILGAIATFLILNATGVISLNSASTSNVLVIKVDDITSEYTGEAIKPTSYTILDNKKLATGETLTPTYYGEQLEIGSSASSMKAVIKDKNNKDVTSKYKITYEVGKIEVTKRNVSLYFTDTLSGASSNIVSKYVVTSGSLLEGHSAEGTINSSSLTYGYKLDMPLEVKIYDEDDEDVTDKYNITKDKSSITRSYAEGSKRNLNLVFSSYEQKYQSGLSIKSSDVISLISPASGTLLQGDYLDTSDLSVHFCLKGSYSSQETITSSGEYEVLLTSASVKHIDGTKSNDYTFDTSASIGYINIQKGNLTAVFGNLTNKDNASTLPETVKLYDEDGKQIGSEFSYTIDCEGRKLTKKYGIPLIASIGDIEDLKTALGSSYTTYSKNYNFTIVQGTYTLPIDAK